MKSSIFLVCFFLIGITFGNKSGIGIFDGHADVGKVLHKGSAVFNEKTGEYTVEGAGANIWTTHDEFHFVWKKMKGNFVVKTKAAFIGKGVELHRKFGWMVRTTLDSSATHVNAVVHGDGLTSLQFRKTVGGVTEEKRSKLTWANVVQLERKGNTYTMSVAKDDGALVTEQVDLNLGDDVYVGLFVCSHNKDVSEKAVFSNVSIEKK